MRAAAPGWRTRQAVKFLWPKFRDGLKLYETSPAQWPVAIGFALQRAIEAGKDVIDPTLAARIAIECAVPMAKIDPERIAKGSAGRPLAAGLRLDSLAP